MTGVAFVARLGSGMDLGPEPWKFDPGDRDPPPTGPLRTVSALVNTINHGVDDSLDRPGTLELWLREFDLPGGDAPGQRFGRRPHAASCARRCG